jgi:UDP-glucose 4-epimerase
LKILITGVYGYVGYNIFLALKKKYKVIGIGRRNNKKINFNKSLFNKKINKINLISLNFKPDIILHCAGSGSVLKSIKNKKLDYQKNVSTTKELVNFLSVLKKKPRVIFFSSAAVYGNNCEKTLKEVKPISPYGTNKFLSEEILRKSSLNLNFELNVLRFYSIYGSGLTKQLIWDACKKIQNNKNVFFGSGNELRSWIHIKDVINFISFLIRKKTKNFAIFDVAGNDVIKNKILLIRLFRLFKYKKIPKFNNINKKGDPKNQICNNKKIKKLGWRPKYNLSKGLKDYLKWFKSNIE